MRIKGYDEINMEIFADLIPLTAKREYVRKIFHGYSPLELADVIHTLECFFEHDGSITQTAAALYIHKNTLQQHLKKIAARTGYDPRSLRCSAVFYVVLYFYRICISQASMKTADQTAKNRKAQQTRRTPPNTSSFNGTIYINIT